MLRFLLRPTPSLAGLLLASAFSSQPALADVFTYVDHKGKEQTVTARLAGTGGGYLALEVDDGLIHLVPQEKIRSRTPGDDPQPVSHAEMAERLKERFTEPLFVSRTAEPYIVGLVLTAPLDEETKPRVDRFLDKAAGFMQQVDGVFTRFAEKMGIPLQPPRYPLVMLIFETDADFNAYTKMSTGGYGPSASNILGFYSGLTNWLAIRLDECDSFEVPLHEAIHQQVYNRGVLQRLAPVPSWFDEGIATGFESDGSKINVDPTNLNRQYGGSARRPFKLTFAEVIEHDDAFHGDILAGEAYTLAWCLHWMLVTTKPAEYTQYVKKLGAIEPLADVSEKERLAEFRDVFDIDPRTLEQMIGGELADAARKQRVRLEPQSVAVGKLITQDQMGHLEIGLVRRADKGGLVQGIGKLKNLSPFRTLTFRVTATHEGRGIAWLAEEVGPGRRIDLERKLMPPSEAGYEISIRSAIPGTPQEETLKALPR